jgi:hypothetical protein
LARVLYERKPPVKGQKLFLAVQCYEGIGAGCAYTLFQFGQVLKEAGIEVELSATRPAKNGVQPDTEEDQEDEKDDAK